MFTFYPFIYVMNYGSSFSFTPLLIICMHPKNSISCLKCIGFIAYCYLIFNALSFSCNSVYQMKY